MKFSVLCLLSLATPLTRTMMCCVACSTIVQVLG
jgi:hypothetical protein